MVIRPAPQADIPALVELNRQVHSLHAAACPEGFTKDPASAAVGDAFAGALAEPSAYWLLAEDTLPVGFLAAGFIELPENWFRPPYRHCYISEIVVDPSARRRGVARQLVAALKSEAGLRGFNRIDLDVWSFNSEARAAFSRLGFEIYIERRTLSIA